MAARQSARHTIELFGKESPRCTASAKGTPPNAGPAVKKAAAALLIILMLASRTLRGRTRRTKALMLARRASIRRTSSSRTSTLSPIPPPQGHGSLPTTVPPVCRWEGRRGVSRHRPWQASTASSSVSHGAAGCVDEESTTRHQRRSDALQRLPSYLRVAAVQSTDPRRETSRHESRLWRRRRGADAAKDGLHAPRMPNQVDRLAHRPLLSYSSWRRTQDMNGPSLRPGGCSQSSWRPSGVRSR